MKNFIQTIIALFAVVLIGCQTDIPTDDIIYSDDPVTLTVNTVGTRTSLGDKSDDTYPVYWSKGDKIVVNGVESEEAVINSSNASSAEFTINASCSYPFNVTYPYTSTTTASAPKVLFPAEQSYVEGSFSHGSAPMYGYATTKGKAINLKHLAGILRFSIKGSKNGTLLQKVVITSSDTKIAGEFIVNCSSGAISATTNATNVVTYTLPANYALSTSEESAIYIALPASNVGNCKVEFIDTKGEKMSCNWSGGQLKAGIIREFNTIVYTPGVTSSLAPLEVESDELEITYPTVYGYVKDTSGKPISGVAVSDGFSVVTTDSNGYYSINVSRDCWYIYISLPSEYEVPINEYGQPCFFKKYPSNTPQYDFTLKPLPNGKEKKFALFAIGDPQVSSATKLKRFNNEAVPGLKAYSTEMKSKGIPCYGITLGDIISNSDSSNSGGYRDDMRDGFHVSKTGLPIFQVMGNHDNTFCNTSQPLFADEHSSHFEFKQQREFETMFGPVNYSFNRGDVHIIGMRDIVYTTNTSGAKYQAGFLPSQWEWLKQDLAAVPKDKMVVLCVHIQLLNRDQNYIQDVFKLFDQYKEAHIISGHTHYMLNYEHTVEGTGHKIYEHNSCALCGCWWAANIAGDGSPNGFQVFIGEGNTFTDWYYMGYSEGMNTKSHQMRLYRGNQVNGAAKSGTDTYGSKGYYGFNFSDDVLVANVYNADSKWTIKVYENGVYSGNMSKLKVSQPSYSALIGTGTLEDPKRAADGVVTSHDFYVAGLLLGVLGRNPSSAGSWTSCYHLYQYKLKNKNATIKVVATDRFGNEYTETKITSGTDFSATKAK